MHEGCHNRPEVRCKLYRCRTSRCVACAKAGGVHSRVESDLQPSCCLHSRFQPVRRTQFSLPRGCLWEYRPSEPSHEPQRSLRRRDDDDRLSIIRQNHMHRDWPIDRVCGQQQCLLRSNSQSFEWRRHRHLQHTRTQHDGRDQLQRRKHWIGRVAGNSDLRITSIVISYDQYLHAKRKRSWYLDNLRSGSRPCRSDQPKSRLHAWRHLQLNASVCGCSLQPCSRNCLHPQRLCPWRYCCRCARLDKIDLFNSKSKWV